MAAVPRVHIIPVKIADIENLPVNQFVDVVAVMDSCQDLSLITRRDGTETKKRSVTLKDDSARTIELTMWGDKVDDPGMDLFERSRRDEHPVIVIKGAPAFLAPPS
jgi:replication factor A1